MREVEFSGSLPVDLPWSQRTAVVQFAVFSQALAEANATLRRMGAEVVRAQRRMKLAQADMAKAIAAASDHSPASLHFTAAATKGSIPTSPDETEE